jgi:hypothetical protein
MRLLVKAERPAGAVIRPPVSHGSSSVVTLLVEHLLAAIYDKMLA